MLENIIGQNVTTLRQELTDGCFPSAALFYGPPYSGKLSTALEVARVLTCENRQGAWSCNCASCRKQRVITHPYTLLLGYRYFLVEISAAADVLRRTRKEAARYLFVRAVRKLTRRFDAVFWEGSKIGAWQSAILEIEEVLDLLCPEAGIPLAQDKKLEDQLDRIMENCRPLLRALSEETIPINQIRRAVNWLHMTSSAENANKVLILENADRMHDAPSNSLLKLLEEPPPQVTILLISTRKGALMQTILSRLRPYAFVQRSPESEGEVLERIFRENPSEYRSLRDYFLYWKDLNPDSLATLLRRFIDVMMTGNQDEELLQEAEQLLKNKTGREFMNVFIEELMTAFQNLLHTGQLDGHTLSRYTDTLRGQYDALRRYNKNPLLTFETLYYGLGIKQCSRFYERALAKIEKMDKNQVRVLVENIASENELLEMVMESMTDGVVVTDKDHRILRINKSSERMIPIGKDEMSDQKIWEIVQDADISRFLKTKLLSQERVTDKEFTLSNGFTRIVALSIMPLVRQGRVQGNVIHLEDVTEKRSKEARLRRAESLAALTTLTAGVAHEIKNPLASIGIHIELINKAMKGRQSIKTGRVDEYLSVISEEVDRLNRIVVDYLFTVRPMNTVLECQDINLVIRELLEFLKFELEEANIEVKLSLGEHIPQIRLDEKYMKQALLNIIKNAISAMPRGGVLSIETEQAGNELYLKISDTGVGIPEENLSKIFEPYFTTKDFGSGLGLTLVYKIVKEHLGDISLDSKEGEGTTFVLSFPLPETEKHLIHFRGETA